MKPLRAFGPLRSRFMLKPVPDLPPLRPIDTVADDEAKLETKVQGWIEKVGEARARSAATLAQERTGSTTLPELLAEIYLRGIGARYRAQFDYGWARPDFVVFDAPGAPGAAMIWRVQGDYWHGTAEAQGRDAAQRDMLFNEQAEGAAVARVIDLWESAIYASDEVFDLAYHQGVEQARV